MRQSAGALRAARPSRLTLIALPPWFRSIPTFCPQRVRHLRPRAHLQPRGERVRTAPFTLKESRCAFARFGYVNLIKSHPPSPFMCAKADSPRWSKALPRNQAVSPARTGNVWAVYRTRAPIRPPVGRASAAHCAPSGWFRHRSCAHVNPPSLSAVPLARISVFCSHTGQPEWRVVDQPSNGV